MVDMSTYSTDSSAEPCKAEPSQTRFGLLVGGVYRRWRREVDETFQPMGLSDATRMPMLILHASDGPMRQKDIAEALFIDTSALVRVLDVLKKMQFIEWQNDPADRRSKWIALTAEGRAVAAAILQKSLEIERTILAGIAADELQITRKVLARILDDF